MLLIDSGNSALKCRWINAGRVEDRTFVVRDEHGLTAFAEYLRARHIDSIFLASVSDSETTQTIRSLIERNASGSLVQLKTLASLGGLSNGYIDYRQLGVDRWMALLGAYQLSDRDVIVVDAGSAITIDLLSLSKGHLGGAILPGFRTSKQRFIQMFPCIDFGNPDLKRNELPGHSTMECLNPGCFPSTVSVVNRVLLDWQQYLEAPLNVYLCGQDAALLDLQLELDHRLVPDLVFKGMLKQIELQG